jgi:hypothetical protein
MNQKYLEREKQKRFAYNDAKFQSIIELNLPSPFYSCDFPKKKVEKKETRANESAFIIALQFCSYMCEC